MNGLGFSIGGVPLQSLTLLNAAFFKGHIHVLLFCGNGVGNWESITIFSWNARPWSVTPLTKIFYFIDIAATLPWKWCGKAQYFFVECPTLRVSF